MSRQPIAKLASTVLQHPANRHSAGGLAGRPTLIVGSSGITVVKRAGFAAPTSSNGGESESVVLTSAESFFDNQAGAACLRAPSQRSYGLELQLFMVHCCT
nr:hypothetical protein CFP56_53724 [Quercus suber]